MSEASKVLSRKDGHTGYVIFNNPERMNAMSLEMWATAATVMDGFVKDGDIRCIVLTGAGGKAFVSGADISKFDRERSTEASVKIYNDTVERASQALLNFPKPTIAMIQGYCLGGGMALAACCDLRIASDNSRFAVPAAKLGLGYGYAGIKRLTDLVGTAYTREIFFTARQFDAAEALHMGLVNRVVPVAELESYVANYAATIGNNAPLTIEAVKYSANQALLPDHERDWRKIEAMVDRCFHSTDYAEGRKAFMEKRKPVFTGK